MSPAEPGTPCVSRDSMTTQMEYIHMQKPIDGIWHNETITGVPVLLTAINSNGDTVNVGTVTTDGYYGTFSKSWTPPAEGEYKIIASFAGDDSYGGSSAATSVTVGQEASTPTATPQIQTNIDNTMTIIGTGIAIIIAVIISVAVAVLLLRKR